MYGYLITTITPGNLPERFRTSRELLDVAAGLPELPAALERVDAIVRETTSAMNTAGETSEREWIPWDRTLDAIEADRDRAADLDPAGVRYTLPDGRTIDATRVDTDDLDDMARGFVTCALWSNGEPLADQCETCNGTGEDVDPDNENATPRHPACEDCNGRGTVEPAELGGLEHLTPTTDALERARVYCAMFLAVAQADDVAAHLEGLPSPDGNPAGEYLGHTFYLAAGGSGVSFSDRAWKDDDPLTPVCERLDVAARKVDGVEDFSLYQVDADTADVA